METHRLQNFTDLLKLIAKKPGFYLAPDEHGNCQSIQGLSSFIIGFQVGQHLKGDASVLNEFTAWVCHRYGVAEGARNWAGHILERTGGDQSAAFQLFCDHFEDYLKERESIGSEAITARYIAMLERQRGSDNDYD